MIVVLCVIGYLLIGVMSGFGFLIWGVQEQNEVYSGEHLLECMERDWDTDGAFYAFAGIIWPIFVFCFIIYLIVVKLWEYIKPYMLDYFNKKYDKSDD